MFYHLILSNSQPSFKGVAEHGELYQHRYSLLCGVQQLVLAAAAVTDTDAGVCPQAADCLYVTSLQLGDLHRVYFLQPFGKHLKDSKKPRCHDHGELWKKAVG